MRQDLIADNGSYSARPIFGSILGHFLNTCFCHAQRTAGRQEAAKECQICLDSFKRGTKILELPCEHGFCLTCIRRWLHNHRTCPVCRFEFPDQHTVLVK